MACYISLVFLLCFPAVYSDNRNNHVYQRKIVCELHEDGTVGFYEEVALDGKELIVFDKEKVAYAPATQEAVLLMQLWTKHYADAKSNKLFMENECTQHMKVYISFIKSFLTKKEFKGSRQSVSTEEQD
ncbi:hypothetical protein XELAEV_18040593mg [Xenopus laevis]|uniref:MHC class I-like antigen recognition-like domain-containing protein n=1 Tax=Xenopus laevis TaxID=8355 RepID=A0A974CAE0_XENLA|nr:hypothetical protein XELAEV_18040593mg [Xenopus laevis]